MADKSDGILSFEVKLTAKSSDEIKALIQDAKEIEETKRQEKQDLKDLRAKQREQKKAEKEANMVETEDGRKVTRKQYERMRARKRAKDEKAEQQAIDESIEQFGEEAKSEAVGEVPEISDRLKKAKGVLDEIDETGLTNIKAFASNPESMIQNKLINILSVAGPYGAIASAVIGMVIAAPEVFKAVIEALAVKGGPLNLDFEYSIAEQIGQEFDRRMQFRRITGDNPVITVDTHGYVAGDPDFAGNSLVDSEITRTARISIKQKSLSFTSGI